MNKSFHKPFHKPYEVYQKKNWRRFLIIFSCLCITMGIMLILSSMGKFPWLRYFLKGFNEELSFLAMRNGQLFIGMFLSAFFSWVLVKNIVSFFKRKPILIADDFGLEISQISDYSVVGWEYIEKISIERYARSNSERKRLSLIIRYSNTNKDTIFIPVSSLTKPGEAVLKELALRNKQTKF